MCQEKLKFISANFLCVYGQPNFRPRRHMSFISYRCGILHHFSKFTLKETRVTSYESAYYSIRVNIKKAG